MNTTFNRQQLQFTESFIFVMNQLEKGWFSRFLASKQDGPS